MLKVRDENIDFLKTIGILAIILAHVSPTPAIFELRNFDVVMMIFASGMAFSLNNTEISTMKKYLEYLKSRFVRLVIPTWVFITVYFILFLTKKIATYMGAYSLLGGFGYVWIFRVFLMMAIIAPGISWVFEHFEIRMVLF